jgi:biotin carboxyl carrier protein
MYQNDFIMKEYKYTINGNKYEVVIGDIVENIAEVKVNGEDYKVEMELPVEPEKPVVKPAAAAKPASTEGASAPKAGINKANAIKAPLPGVITDIRVKEGDEVQVRDVVIVLEAMKMANNLTAEKAGKVTAICVGVGESVMEDDALVVIE